MNRLLTGVVLISTIQLLGCTAKKQIAQKEEIVETEIVAEPQSTPEMGQVEDSDPVFMVVEEMPEFPGGSKAMYQFLKDSMRYPNLPWRIEYKVLWWSTLLLIPAEK